MELKQLAVIIPGILLSTSSVIAQEYQSFSSIGFTKIDNLRSYNTTAIDTTYFFEKKQVLGPLDQLNYINTASNVFGNYSHSDNSDNVSVGGSVFIDNLVVGGAYSYADYDSGSADNYSARLGYLFSENFIVNAYANKSEGVDTDYRFSASYNHQLTGNDYIGFTYSSDDDFDYQMLSSTYFRSLAGGQYLVAALTYQDNDDFENDLGGNLSFYFNNKTSLSASYDDDDNFGIGAQHFFSQNYSLSLRYQSNSSDELNDYDIYSVNVNAQF